MPPQLLGNLGGATSASAAGRGRSVAEDGISADSDFEVFYARYHMLRGNPDNAPLAERAVTLTHMENVTFADRA